MQREREREREKEREKERERERKRERERERESHLDSSLLQKNEKMKKKIEGYKKSTMKIAVFPSWKEAT
jgi:hypothetical protein